MWKFSKTDQRQVIVLDAKQFTNESASKIAKETGRIAILAHNVRDAVHIPDLKMTEGDGKAEFIGTGTQEEYEEFQREEKGFKGLFGIGK